MSLDGHTVLILEDNDADAHWIKCRVEALGASARRCSSVDEARDLAERFDWSAYLVDLNVPLKPGELAASDGGKHFQQWLKGRVDPGTPVILVSGQVTSLDEVAELIVGGFTHANFKDTTPYGPRKLTDKLLEGLKDRPLPRNAFLGGRVVRSVRFVGTQQGKRRLLVVNPNRHGEGEELYVVNRTFRAFLRFAALASYQPERLVDASLLPERFSRHMSELVKFLNEKGFEVPDGLHSVAERKCRRLNVEVSFDAERLRSLGQDWQDVKGYALGG